MIKTTASARLVEKAIVSTSKRVKSVTMLLETEKKHELKNGHCVCRRLLIDARSARPGVVKAAERAKPGDWFIVDGEPAQSPYSSIDPGARYTDGRIELYVSEMRRLELEIPSAGVKPAIFRAARPSFWPDESDEADELDDGPEDGACNYEYSDDGENGLGEIDD